MFFFQLFKLKFWNFYYQDDVKKTSQNNELIQTKKFIDSLEKH